MGKELFETLPDVLDANAGIGAFHFKGRSIPAIEPSGFSNLAGGRTETCHKAEAGFVDGTAYKYSRTGGSRKGE